MAKVPVSLAALTARINRKLAHDDEMLRKSRSERARADLGDYFIVNVTRNLLVAKDVDPEALGRELEVLQPWEALRE